MVIPGQETQKPSDGQSVFICILFLLSITHSMLNYAVKNSKYVIKLNAT